MAEKKIVTPDLGGSAEVTVIEILVKPGDKVEVDTPVVTLESDKATMEVPSTEAGIVKAIKVKKGDNISAGSVILTLESGAAEAKPAEKSGEKAGVEHEEHAGHNDYNVAYVLDCAKPSAITSIQFDYFKSFAGAKALTVNVVSEKAQNSYEVTREKPVLDLGGTM